MFLFIMYDHWSGIQFSPLPLSFTGRGSVFFHFKVKKTCLCDNFSPAGEKSSHFQVFSPRSEKKAI